MRAAEGDIMSDTTRATRLESGGFLLFLAAISLALLAVVLPFFQPLLWAVLAAILFQPLYRWFLTRRKGRETQAALHEVSPAEELNYSNKLNGGNVGSKCS